MREHDDDPEVHWTRKLFVENAELYLPFLEQAREHAPQEVEALSGLFTEFGVPAEVRVFSTLAPIQGKRH